ncbi:MAG: invasion associated locus B family protein [Pseudomonadota bacterium]
MILLERYLAVPAVLAAALSLSAPAIAQDSTGAETEAPAAETDAPATDAPSGGEGEGGSEDLGLSMGTPVDDGAAASADQIGQPYLLETSGDWEIRCVRTSLEHDPCALHQLLQDEADNSVATIELVNLPPDQAAAAGATIVTPLETLLTEQITLQVDGGQGRRYPFSFCTQIGCVSRVGFTDAEVDAFRRGAEATLTIVPATARDAQVRLGVSLIGISAGLERIIELNALNAEAINAARAAQDAAAE